MVNKKLLVIFLTVLAVATAIIGTIATLSTPLVTKVEAKTEAAVAVTVPIETQSGRFQVQEVKYWDHSGKEFTGMGYYSLRLVVICDTLYGNLLYSTGVGLTTVKDGCHKIPR